MFLIQGDWKYEKLCEWRIDMVLVDQKYYWN